MRRPIAASAITLGLLAAGAVPALAAPINSHAPRAGDVFPLDCGSLGLVDVVAPPNDANFTPGFIVGTHQLVLPYSFVFTVTSGGQTFTDTMAKKARVPANAVTCTFEGGFNDPDGTSGSFSVVVVGVLRGAP